MSAPNFRCSIPKWLGNRVHQWFEKHFAEDCHVHDQRYGSVHPKTMTRWQADEALRLTLAAKGYPLLGWVVFFYVRIFGIFQWKEYQPPAA